MPQAFDPQQILERLEGNPALAFSFIALSAFLEYVFPPFPGDAATLFAAFLVGNRGWSFPAVFIAVNLGALAGSVVDYAAGRWLGAPGRTWRHRGPRWERLGVMVDRIARGFERHGALYIAVNRFFPSVRAFFFLAAGVARFPLWKVVVFGLLSSVVWNLLILLAGRWIGGNFDRLKSLFQTYSAAAWAALAVLAIVLLLRWWRRRKRMPQGGGEG